MAKGEKLPEGKPPEGTPPEGRIVGASMVGFARGGIGIPPEESGGLDAIIREVIAKSHDKEPEEQAKMIREAIVQWRGW